MVSNGSILQYFQPSLIYHLSLRSMFCQFLSGHFTQVIKVDKFVMLKRYKGNGHDTSFPYFQSRQFQLCLTTGLLHMPFQ